MTKSLGPSCGISATAVSPKNRLANRNGGIQISRNWRSVLQNIPLIKTDKKVQTHGLTKQRLSTSR